MNNKRHILFEDWMSSKDFLIRRAFYGGTANPLTHSGNISTTVERVEMYDRIDVNSQMTGESFKKWDTYTTCSKELFEYSLRGISSIYL